MGLHWVIMLAFAILLMGANAKDAGQTDIAQPHLSAIRNPLATNKNTATSNRMLRTYDGTADGDNKSSEERTGNSVFAKFADQIAYKAALEIKENPMDVFQKSRFAMSSVNLNHNPAFFRWLEYVNNYWTKVGDSNFSERAMFNLLLESRPEDELVALFQSMRRVKNLENIGDKMQRYMFDSSPTSHKLMNEVWLKSRESPMEVFTILRLGDDALERNSMFIQWLEYIKVYRASAGCKEFSDAQAIEFLLDKKFFTVEQKFGVLFQSIKEIPGLKKLAENMQTQLFRKWINTGHGSPHIIEDMLMTPHGSWETVLLRPKSDPRFQTLEAYTLQYAADRGGKTMQEKVMALFANNDHAAALATAIKL